MSAPGHPFSSHDHHACSGAALAEAEALLAAKRARLTPVRRRVLEILLEAHRAMGAYEVLDRLAAEGYGRQPPVAYRALEFLVEHGLAHRVQMLNAFAACLEPSEAHDPAFLICKGCNRVAEAPADRVRAALVATAGDLDFTIERIALEAVGICPSCRDAA